MIKCPKCGYQKPKKVNIAKLLKGRKKAMLKIKEIYA